MKYALISLFSLMITSCFSIQRAPKIDTYKLQVARKFQRKLPKRQAFVFSDLKGANDFYYFIEERFKSNFDNFQWNVSIIINGKTHNFTIYEVEKSTKTVNLIPILIDLSRTAKDKEALFEDAYSSRSGSWYLAITVSENAIKDCLNSNDAHRLEVIEFVDFLRLSYLNDVGQF